MVDELTVGELRVKNILFFGSGLLHAYTTPFTLKIFVA
jgi:hypothetical protein